MVRNRNTAIKTLEAWGADRWPPDALAALREAAALEPRDDVRERLMALIR